MALEGKTELGFTSSTDSLNLQGWEKKTKLLLPKWMKGKAI